MKPLYTRQYEEPDGAIMQMRWGYCREQNAVCLGYAVNILAAVVGLALMFIGGAHFGLTMCVCVGASFGAAHFAEQMKPGFLHSASQGVSIGATLGAYLIAIRLIFGG